MTALSKEDGGVRPIAVGLTLRRLVAKVAGFQVRDEMSDLLAPRQLGYGVKGGAEAAVHAARVYIQDSQQHFTDQQDRYLLKLDFLNAFNSIRRDKMLKAVVDFVPDLFPLVYSAYTSPSALLWNGEIIDSAEGVQQGDPLGPLLFCLTNHLIFSCLSSEFCVWYLDDGTLGDSSRTISKDLDLVTSEGAARGLLLNQQKTEVVFFGTVAPSVFSSSIPMAQLIPAQNATLLGSSVGNVNAITSVLSDKTNLLQVMGERLQHLSSQDSLLLLRHSFSIPKVLYLLRTAPTFLSSGLATYDEVQRSILESITNVSLDDNAWTQASLPVRNGGLGIRSASVLAPSAYLASVTASHHLILQILPLRLQMFHIPFESEALSCWSIGNAFPPPVGTDAHLQKVWDSCRVESLASDLLESAPDAVSRARLLAASTAESGAWLNALPLSSMGLQMDNNTVRVAVGLRLGVPLCHPHFCQHCSEEVDQLGTHGLHCKFSQGRFYRHGALNNIIKRSLTAAHVPSRLEPVGMSRSDGKRPDGASTIPWERGKLLVWDVTCPDTLAPSYLPLATRNAREVATAAETRKSTKYAHLDCHFVPIAIETVGCMGPRTLKFLKDLGRRLERVTDSALSYVYLVQRLSVALQWGNAASVLGTIAI